MSMMTIWRGSTASPTTLDDAVLYAPLTHTAIPTRGSITPSFTRATTETGQKWDEAGYLDFTALAGEIVFKGARRVRNWIQAPTENWSSAGWVKSGISVSGNRLTATGANGVIYDNAALGMGTDRTAVGSVTLSRVTGTGNVDISTNGGTTWTTVSVTGARVSVSLTGNINGQFAIRIVTSGDAVDATYPQLEDVTGQTTQTASEYVSVGVPADWAGTDLVTNGTFDTDTTGWTAVNSTLSIVSGKLRVTNVGANAGYCHQAITTVVGQKYVLSATVTQQTSATYSIYIGNGPGSGTLGGLGTAASVEFTATATTTYLSTINTQAVDGRYTDFDNISVKPTAYHGSMVDGVKCYDTDRSGNPISTSGSYPLVGYVPWGARTNLCIRSQEFDHAAWIKGNGGAGSVPVVTANAGVAPDGTTTADKVVFAAPGAGDLSVLNSIAFATVIASSYTSAVYAKAFAAGDIGKQLLTRQAGASGYTAITLSADWQRLGTTEVAAGVATTFDILLRPSFGGSSGTVSCYLWQADVQLGTFITPAIPTTTVAVARNADVEAVTTSGAILAVGGTISLTYIPYHSPVGTIALWGTYVDASNYTAILHDATNLIFRKRIAGVNYDATIANAFTSGTTYKMAVSWGSGGSTIYLNGVAGTPHANTTAAQIAATMQFGADGNSLQQPGAAVIKNYIWQRQLSGSEQAAITA